MSDTPSSQRASLWPLLLCLCTAAVYANSYWGEFFFDDFDIITRNPSLHNLGNLGRVLFEFPNVTRPVVSLSFALDYALWGADPHPYHLGNILIHLVSTLLLFGIVRRSLLSPRMPAKYREASGALAFAVALLWAVHPLQTESVTYIVQRGESMMGMFFLLALYGGIRGAASPRALLWNLLAIAAAVLGAGCKQVIAMLPFVMLLYDRCFISGTFKGALRRAPLLYAGMLLSWVVVGLLFAAVKESASAGFGMKGATPFEYARSQFVVLSHYLRLTFWPAGLCLEYAWSVETNMWRIASGFALIAVLLGCTAWQLIRNTAHGFWGAWFFLILAPTSTVMPIRDLAVEHRMYLPLAGVLTVVVLVLYEAARRRISTGAEGSEVRSRKIVLAAVAPIAVIFGALTIARNAQYHDYVGMWRDVLRHAPANANALSIVGYDLLERGRPAEARQLLERALAADPNNAGAHANLGAIHAEAGEFALAEDSFRRALQIYPKHERAWVGLIEALRAQGKNEVADQIVAGAQSANPGQAWVDIARAQGLFSAGKYMEAAQAYAQALQREPEQIELNNNLGSALAAAGKFDEAERAFDALLSRQPTHAKALYNRGNVFERKKQFKAAVADYSAASASDPSNASALNALAWLLATAPDDSVRDGKAAVKFADEACALTRKENPLMLDTLAAALAESGRFEEALTVVNLARKLAAPEGGLSAELQRHAAEFREKRALRSP